MFAEASGDLEFERKDSEFLLDIPQCNFILLKLNFQRKVKC